MKSLIGKKHRFTFVIKNKDKLMKDQLKSERNVNRKQKKQA